MTDLASSGLSAAQLALVMELSAAIATEARPAIDRAAENKRSYDRQYAREHRKNRTISYDHNDAKGSNDRDILTSKGLPPKPNGLDPKPKKHRLPADWQPLPFTLGTMAAQVVDRWEPGRIERELAKFRDHHAAAGTRWENWQAAWSKWVNNSGDFERGRSGTGTGGKSATAFAMLSPGEEPF